MNMSPKTTKTLKYNGATITVRTEDGNAYIDSMAAQITLGIYETYGEAEDGHEAGERKLSRRVAFRRSQFAAVWSQSEVDGDLGFPWPESPTDAETMIAGCEAWLSLPGTFVGEWINAVNVVNIPPNDPDLRPPEQMEKKD